MLALVAEQRSTPKAAPKAPESSRHLVPPTIKEGGRERLASISGVPTELLTLTPAFMDALRKVAPKKRRSKIPYVIALGLLAFVVMLGADPSTREFGLSKLAASRTTPAAAPATEPAAVATAVTTLTSADVPTVSTPVASLPTAPVVKADEAAPAPAPAPVPEASPAKKSSAKATPVAQPKKAQPRAASRPASQRRTAMVK
jgi:hypothetical protein